MSVIDTLITDRSSTDVIRYAYLAAKEYEDMTASEKAEWDGVLKGSYDVSDVNRVGQAVAYLTSLLAAAGYTVTTNPKIDWTKDDEVTPELYAQYLADIATLRNALTYSAPTAPTSVLTIQQANEIETILVALNDALTRLSAVLVKSGVYNSGNVYHIKECGKRFQRVAYLISTKGITITGTKLTNNSEIRARVYRPSGAVAQYIYQADSGSALTTNFTAYTSAGGSATGYWRFGSTYAALAVSTGSWHETKQNKSGIWIDGSKVATYSSVNPFTTTNSLTIHGTAASANMRIAWLERWENGVYAASYWPVKDLVTDKYGYLDTSDGSFWTNDEATITAGGEI